MSKKTVLLLVGILWFVAWWVLAMWKGDALLRLPPWEQLSIVLGVFLPYGGWILLLRRYWGS